MQPPKVLCVFGPPCAGKSTFIWSLAANLDFRPLSVGEELRKLAKSDDPHAAVAAQLLAAGSSMPPWLSTHVLPKAIRRFFPSSLALDNFPRTADQLLQLPDILNACDYDDADVRGVIIELDEDMALSRLATRGGCNICGFIGDMSAVFCPRCGSLLEVRSDDLNAAAVRRRFETFRNLTMPVIAEFGTRHLLLRVPGNSSAAEQVKFIRRWWFGE